MHVQEHSRHRLWKTFSQVGGLPYTPCDAPKHLFAASSGTFLLTPCNYKQLETLFAAYAVYLMGEIYFFNT